MSGHHKLTGEVAKLAINVIHDIADALDKTACPYCLEGGTLLGILREGRLLPWDDDVDLTVMSEHLPALMSGLGLLSRLKYRIRIRQHFTDHGPINSGSTRLVRITRRKFFFWKGPVRVDIFVKYADDTNAFWTVGHPRNFVTKSVPKKFYQQLSSIDFCGKSLSIPCEYDEYLSLRYGEWREPVKEWNCLTDDKSAL